MLFLILALPGAFNPFGVLAFEPLKSSIVRCATLLMVACWMLARLFGAPARDGLYKLPVVWASLAVLATTVPSTLASLDPEQSFFGSLDRGMGLLTQFSGVTILIVGIDLWSSAVRRERTITAVLVGSVPACAYALVQHVGLDPMTWTTDPGAPASSLGSPTFLSGFLVLVAPFTWYRLLLAGRRVARGDGVGSTIQYAAYLALALILAVVLVLTTIRAAFLGLACGAIVFAALVVGRAGRSGRHLAAGAIAAFLLLTLGLASLTGGSSPVVLDRFVAVARLGLADATVPADEGLARSAILSASERIDLWSAALAAPTRDPLRFVLGFGQETQTGIYEQVQRVVNRSMYQRWDRAHNLIMDTWLVGGALGVLTLCLLLGHSFRSTVRVARAESTHALLAATVVASLAGHLVEQMFSFQTVVTGTYFWLVLGVGASLGGAARWRRWTCPAARRVALVVGIGLATLAGLPMLAAPAVADTLYGAALRAERAGAPVAAADLEERAAAWAPWAEELPRMAALNWQALGLARSGPAGDALLSRAAELFTEGVARDRLNPFAHIRLVDHYLKWAAHGVSTGSTDAVLLLAERACSGALESGPFRPTGWRRCAEVSQLRGDAQQAAARLSHAQPG